LTLTMIAWLASDVAVTTKDEVVQSKSAERWLWVASVGGVFAASAVYLVWFGLVHKHPVGQPSAWGVYGDFIGGLVGTMIAAVTLILIFRTLGVSRQALVVARTEADQTRLEMQRQTRELSKQVSQLQDDAVARDFQRRLDGVLDDWRRALAVNVKGVIGWSKQSMYEVTPRAREAALTELPVVTAIYAVTPEHPERASFVARWTYHFSPLGLLLHELATYCEEYEALVGNAALADYYRRRVAPYVRLLSFMEIIVPELEERLRV
jgi:hypothetical protein